jgi:hypothetical protein
MSPKHRCEKRPLFGYELRTWLDLFDHLLWIAGCPSVVSRTLKSGATVDFDRGFSTTDRKT